MYLCIDTTMSNQQQLIELWEIAVFLNQQAPTTQQIIRETHKKSEIQAIFLVRNEMQKLGYFK